MTSTRPCGGTWPAFLLAAIAGCAVAAMPTARAAGTRRDACGPCVGAGGMPTPCGDTGCGPKYRGARYDEPWTPDPCDGCNRWRGCNGGHQATDMLAPWQLPPGRGFRSAADVGYAGNGGGGPCLECRSACYRLW